MWWLLTVLRTQEPGLLLVSMYLSKWKSLNHGVVALLVQSKSSWSTKQVPGQPGLHKETLSRNKTATTQKQGPVLRILRQEDSWECKTSRLAYVARHCLRKLKETAVLGRVLPSPHSHSLCQRPVRCTVRSVQRASPRETLSQKTTKTRRKAKKTCR